MTHNELIFILLVSGTQLNSKSIEESHMVPKNYSELNCVNIRLYGWYLKPYKSHTNTGIYRLSFYGEFEIFRVKI